jgi:transposase-like protein
MGRESRSKEIRRQLRVVGEQIKLPLVEALVDVRAEMLEVVHTAGMKVVEALLEEDRVRLSGPRYARRPGREMVRGGTVMGELTLGGRRIQVRRPRLRKVGGGEVRLPSYENLSTEDPLERRAVEQMLVGVSTRKYDRSLEPLPHGTKSRGTGRSSVSRRFVARTQAEVDAWTTRSLRELDLVALMIDGIEFGEHTLVAALGIDATGTKHPLALREGSTENATLCREMLADMIERGVAADRAILVVMDGGKALRSAVRQTFGEYALVQRCQAHKRRNVVDQLPEYARARVKAAMDDAYAADDFVQAQHALEKLAVSVEQKHPSAAQSLREGLDETLTVLRLNIGPTLRRSLATTNPIESMFSTVRRVSGRVTRWPSGTMALRWALAGMGEAQKRFRRLMGKNEMPKLAADLRRLDLERERARGGKRAAVA